MVKYNVNKNAKCFTEDSLGGHSAL